MIIVNGKKYQGNNITIGRNNKVIIDGEIMDDGDEKVINVFIEGNVENLTVDTCESIEIIGMCKSVESKNGNITCGDVLGEVETKNGNVICKNVGGKVTTKNGNIIHG